jgi:hypothetical protein
VGCVASQPIVALALCDVLEHAESYCNSRYRRTRARWSRLRASRRQLSLDQQ